MRPIFIEIEAEPIIPAGTFTQNGLTKERPAKQKAYVHNSGKYPLEITVKIPEAGPYRPGRYLLAGSVFKAGQFGLDFRTGNMELVSVDDAIAELTGSAAPKLKAAS